MKHQTRLGSLELTADWQDVSTYQFVTSGELPGAVVRSPKGASGAARLSIVMSSLTLGPGETAEGAAQGHIAAMQGSLPGFRLMERVSWPHPTLGEVPGAVIRFEAGGGAVVQATLFIPEGTKRSVVALAISSTEALYAREAPRMREILASFRLS